MTNNNITLSDEELEMVLASFDFVPRNGLTKKSLNKLLALESKLKGIKENKS